MIYVSGLHLMICFKKNLKFIFLTIMRVQHLFLKPNKKKLFAIHFLYFSYMDSQRVVY